MTKLQFARFAVYRVALELLGECDRLLARLPSSRQYLVLQLRRATLSTVLNIAEGAGEHSKPEKLRFYRMARRSATESAAALDALEVLGLRSDAETAKAHALAERAVTMLVRLAKSFE